MKPLSKLAPLVISPLLSLLILNACGRNQDAPPSGEGSKEATATANLEAEKTAELLKMKNAELAQAARLIEAASGEHFGSLALFEESMVAFEKALDGFYASLPTKDPSDVRTKAEKVVSDYQTTLTYLSSLEEANLKLVQELLGSVGKFSDDAGNKRKIALETFRDELKAAQNKLAGVHRLLTSTVKRVRAETAKVLDEVTTAKIFSNVK